MQALALRDRTRITRILILAELQRAPGVTLSDVAKRLDVTVQAVSTHAKSLVAAGWLTNRDGQFDVTPKGLQTLHEGVRSLHDAIEAVASPLAVIHVASAIAASAIRAGEEVGLFMADGDLEAKPGRPGPSRGRARNNAKPGEEVVVGDLRGMVQLRPGRLVVVTVPGPAEGGIALVDRDALRKLLAAKIQAQRVAAHGTGARILARSMAKDGRGRVDLECAADRAAFNAAERGLDVLLYASRDRLPEVIQSFERLNLETLRRVTVEIIDAPERA